MPATRPLVFLCALVVSLALPGASLSQDGGTPTAIHAGGCDGTPGDEVAALTAATVPVGDRVGSDAGRSAATSFTTVPVSLAALTGSEHSLRVGGDDSAACGAIGGVYTDGGALVIVLVGDDGSGTLGIAYLGPNAVDSSQIDVSLVVAGGVAAATSSPAMPTAEVAATAPAARPTPTAVARTSESGTRENPIPLGTAAEIGGGWVVSVVNVVPDEAELVMAENQFNDPPAEGRQFFMVAISATFEGEGSSRLPAGNAFSLVGASSVAYQSFQERCGVIPNEIPSTEVFAGGQIEGNICWSVQTSDIDTVVMYSEDYVTFDRDNRVWFALR